MDIALVEDAQDDVHGDQGRQNQHPLVGEGGLKGLGRPLKPGLNAGRQGQLFLDLVDRVHGVSQGRAGRQVE